MKYVLVTGGVMSGIGKGIVASSAGLLLKAQGRAVTAVKIDPYLNVDAGLMSPHEHGEVYVLDDGTEADLDLGNYERFLGVRLTRAHSITTGQVYRSVIERERRGDYLGKTVQVVPHISDEIQRCVEAAARVVVDQEAGEPEVCVIELGGTIGDIESMPFVEALRQLRFRCAPSAFVHLHLSYVVEVHGEQKSKPTQQSVRELRSLGLLPDVIVCRSARALDSAVHDKVSLFCQLPRERILSVPDVDSIYEVPRMLHALGLVRELNAHFGHAPRDVNLDAWPVPLADESVPVLSVGLVGKYSQPDSYLSITRALEHAAMAQRCRLRISEIDAEIPLSEIEIQAFDGIIVPGGFGERGFEGKLRVARYCRENRIPFLGICLGFQVAVIEIARNACGLSRATSEEFAREGESTASDAVIEFMPDYSRGQLGGSMRLGAHTTLLEAGVLRKFYKPSDTSAAASEPLHIRERHRHRYEVSLRYRAKLEGVVRFTGSDESGQRLSVVELPEEIHPYFMGVQFHPEFNSRPGNPAPAFDGLVWTMARLGADKEK